jgi:SAM-dependent methyltransferase
MTSPPRYDGLADWHDRGIGGLKVTRTAIDALGRLVGAGPGLCLDLGCGTVVAIPELVERGWRVVGVDLSGDRSASPDSEPARPAPRWSRPMPPPYRSLTAPSTRSPRS